MCTKMHEASRFAHSLDVQWPLNVFYLADSSVHHFRTRRTTFLSMGSLVVLGLASALKLSSAAWCCSGKETVDILPDQLFVLSIGVHDQDHENRWKFRDEVTSKGRHLTFKEAT